MAKSYQVAVSPGRVTIADSTTKPGGPRVTISVPSTAIGGIYIGGDENEATDPAKASGGSTLSSTTGLLIAAGSSRDFVLTGTDVINGVSAVSTVTITAHVFRTNARYG